MTVWGDYGRLEGRKVFMGVAQIMLDDLNLNDMVIGWYKLFGTTSLVSGTPSLNLSRRSSATSLESLKFFKFHKNKKVLTPFVSNACIETFTVSEILIKVF